MLINPERGGIPAIDKIRSIKVIANALLMNFIPPISIIKLLLILPFMITIKTDNIVKIYIIRYKPPMDKLWLFIEVKPNITKPIWLIPLYPNNLFTLVWFSAPKVPIIIDNKENINKILELSKIWIKTQIILILGKVATKLTISHEDPSYISGIQKWKGNKLNLKQKDIVIKIILLYTIKSSFNNNRCFRFRSKPYKNTITILKRKNPEDIAPNIKYFKPASELLTEFLFLAIRIKIENVWSSKPKYNNNKLSERTKTTEPKNTKIKRQLTSKVFSSNNSKTTKKDIKIKQRNINFHILVSNKLEFHKPWFNVTDKKTKDINTICIKLFL